MKKRQNDSMMLIWSIGMGLIAVLAVSIFAAFITSKLSNPIEYIEYAAILSSFTGGLACGITCIKKITQNLLSYSAIAGASLAVLLFIISLIAGYGGSTLTRVGVPISMIVGAILPVLLHSPKNSSKKKLKQIKRKYN